jgi:glycosyltransferase involved in cell wall biosynthesis
MLCDFVEDGKNGYVTKWDEHDLAEKMEALVTNDAKRKQFGEKAKETAAEKWNYHLQAKQMKNFYEELLRLGKRK